MDLDYLSKPRLSTLFQIFVLDPQDENHEINKKIENKLKHHLNKYKKDFNNSQDNDITFQSFFNYLQGSVNYTNIDKAFKDFELSLSNNINKLSFCDNFNRQYSYEYETEEEFKSKEISQVIFYII